MNKVRTKGKGKWMVLYTGAFVLSFAASVLFKMTYDPTHGKYKAKWNAEGLTPVALQ